MPNAQFAIGVRLVRPKYVVSLRSKCVSLALVVNFACGRMSNVSQTAEHRLKIVFWSYFTHINTVAMLYCACHLRMPNLVFTTHNFSVRRRLHRVQRESPYSFHCMDVDTTWLLPGRHLICADRAFRCRGTYMRRCRKISMRLRSMRSPFLNHSCFYCFCRIVDV